MSSPPAPEALRPRVLVLQAERVSSTVVRRMLENLGYAGVAAHEADVDGACELLRGDDLAAAVLALDLPGTTSTELAERLRAAAGDVPLLGTALDPDEDVVQACRRWGIRLLASPVAVTQLREALAEVAVPAGGPAVDLSVLTGLVEQIGDADLAQEIVRTYLAEVPGRRERLARGLGAAPDLEEVQRVAHSFKSASATVGASALAEACQQVEVSLRRGETADRQAQIRTALAALDPVVAELEEWLGTDDQAGSKR